MAEKITIDFICAMGYEIYKFFELSLGLLFCKDKGKQKEKIFVISLTLPFDTLPILNSITGAQLLP